MCTLAELGEYLARSSLVVWVAPKGLQVRVREVAVYDPADPPELASGQLVAAVGINPGTVPMALIKEMSRAGVEAVLIKAGSSVDHEGVKAAAAAGLAVISVPVGSSWLRVIDQVRSTLLATTLEPPSQSFQGIAAGDLFGLADAIAELIQAPITIEDPMTHILAFSNRQEEADFARTETILGRRAPDWYFERMRDAGVFKRLFASDVPLFIDGIPPDILPREAVAIRAGDGVLGIIWAAVHQPLSLEKRAALGDAARAAALHILRHRLLTDASDQTHSELVATLLKGGTMAREAAGHLGLRWSEAHHVVALAVGGERSDRGIAELFHAFRQASVHFEAASPNVAVAMVGDTVYSLVPAGLSTSASTTIKRLCEGFLRRVAPDLAEDLLFGIGSCAPSLDEVPRSRHEADQVLRVLRLQGGRQIAFVEEVGTQILLLQCLDFARDDPVLMSPQLRRLREYDSSHRTSYLASLSAWLFAFCDNEAAARALGIHANTMRLRIRRIEELGLLTLRDPNERFALLIELHLDELRAAEEHQLAQAIRTNSAPPQGEAVRRHRDRAVARQKT